LMYVRLWCDVRWWEWVATFGSKWAKEVSRVLVCVIIMCAISLFSCFLCIVSVFFWWELIKGGRWGTKVVISFFITLCRESRVPGCPGRGDVVGNPAPSWISFFLYDTVSWPLWAGGDSYFCFFLNFRFADHEKRFCSICLRVV